MLKIIADMSYKNRKPILLTVILLLAVASRFYISSIFHGQSADEFANVFLTRETFTSGFKDYPELFMWFYYFISGLLLYLFNDALLANNLVTIAFSVASFLLLYLIVCRICKGSAAILTIFLLLINPEFTLIGSTPLRESVYTFFFLLSLLMLMGSRIFWGAFFSGMAFLTKPEGILIAMPLYILSAAVFVPAGRKLKTVCVTTAVFILFILFMNIWLPRPFIYLTGTLNNHVLLQKQTIIDSSLSFKDILMRLFLSMARLLRYLFNLTGLNLIFAFFGIAALYKRKPASENALKFLFFALFPLLFWYIYILVFSGIAYNFHRYFYPSIPFIVFFVSYGFLSLLQKKRLKTLVLFVFIINIIFSYYVYYLGVGRQYITISQANKTMIEASNWIDRNLRFDSNNKLLIDGVEGFYLFRYAHRKGISRWDEFHKVLLAENQEELFRFIRENSIRYVAWTNGNFSALSIAPYLSEFREINRLDGILVPLKQWECNGFMSNVYEFRVRE